MYEIKTKDFSSDEEMFDFSNYSTNSKHQDNSKKLVIGKMKDETGAAIKELVGSKPKMMMPFYVKDNSEHKKQKT